MIKRTIKTHNVVGEFFLPEGDGPFPGVMCIGGSSGGVQTPIAPLLAEVGFATLSLGYFGVYGLPEEFAELPLERFIKGVEWMLDQPVVRGPKVGVTGTSRGSEAALQVATLTPKVGGVVAYVSSGIRWMGVEGRPSWTYDGEPLPYLRWQNDFDAIDGAIAKVDGFNRVLDTVATFADAEIAVERAHCPILLISGKDDRLWPSERMATHIIKRLKVHRYPYPYRHIAYTNAGHRIKVPGLRSENYEPISKDTVTHEMLELGGTYEGNKIASEHAWIETVNFFRSALG